MSESLIDVAEVLAELPHFKKFCSVGELDELAEKIRRECPLAEVRIAGTSSGGLPIHHVRFGHGRIRAFFVGWPHPNEPIGGLTVFGLLSLLKQGNRRLLDADVEWHIVPCIDPDGATLNEGWSQQPFSIGNFLRNCYRQEPSDQVERSFPIHYKRLHFDRPSNEARLLQELLGNVRPDFFYSLHNARLGAVSFFLTHAIDEGFYKELQQLAQTYRVPILQGGSPLLSGHEQYAPGIWELFSAKKYYDYLETVTDLPEEGLHGAGGCSWEYLGEVNHDALTFVMELPYLWHPSSVSTRETSEHLRHFLLRQDAENKFLITVILEEWENVKHDIDSTSPFYRKIFTGIVAVKSKLLEGLPSWESGTSNLLSNPSYNRTMTEADLFYACMKRFYVLCNSHEIVRLLKQSEQTPAVIEATRRLEAVYDQALGEIAKRIDFGAFQVIDHGTLARLHLGGGLIVLNSVLQAHS